MRTIFGGSMQRTMENILTSEEIETLKKSHFDEESITEVRRSTLTNTRKLNESGIKTLNRHSKELKRLILNNIELPMTHKKLLLLIVKHTLLPTSNYRYLTTYLNRLASLLEVTSRTVLQVLKDLAFYNFIDKKSVRGKKGVIIRFRHDIRGNWCRLVYTHDEEDDLVSVQELEDIGLFDDPDDATIEHEIKYSLLEKPDLEKTNKYVSK